MNDAKAIRKARGKTTPFTKVHPPSIGWKRPPSCPPAHWETAWKKKRRRQFTKERRPLASENEWMEIDWRVAREREREKEGRKFHSQSEARFVYGCVCWPSFPSFSFVSWRSLCYKVCLFVFFLAGFSVVGSRTMRVVRLLFSWMKLPPTRTLFFSFVFL